MFQRCVWGKNKNIGQNTDTLTICSPQHWAGSTYTRWWRTLSRCTGWPGPASWIHTRSRFCRPKKMWRWSTWRMRKAKTSNRLQTTRDNIQLHQHHCTVLHLDENWAKWKDSPKADDDRWLHEPERSRFNMSVWLCTTKCLHQRIHDWLCCEEEKGKPRHQHRNLSTVWHKLPFPVGNWPQCLAEGCKR